jgi:hypothetical protein
MAIADIELIQDPLAGRSTLDGGDQFVPVPPTDNLDPAQPITTDSVEERADFEILQQQPATGVDSELGGIEQQQTETQDTLLKETERATKTAQEADADSFTAMISGLLEAPTESELEAEAFGGKGGVDDIQKELDAINQEIRVEQHRLRRQTERLEDNLGGGLAVGVQAEIDNAKRKSFRTQADLSVIQLGIQGRFDSALDIANRAVDAQMEFEQRKIDVLDLQYQRNKELFDKSEQREFELRLQDRQSALETQRVNEERRYGLILDAQQNGAPSSVIRAMTQGRDIGEVLAIGGKYVGALERRLAEANIANVWSQINERGKKDTLSPEDQAKADRKLEGQAGTAQIIVNKVDEALGQVGFFSTGLRGGLLQFVPGTSAFNLDKTVETIKANLGFAELQKMRDNSPTGGALGQVAIQELVALQSTIANLNVGQTDEQITQNLNQVATHYNNWMATMGLVVTEDGEVIQITN